MLSALSAGGSKVTYVWPEINALAMTVTVAVVDSRLPQNWPELLPVGSVDVEHAAGFGAEGWGDFHSQVNAIRGVGGHVGLFPHGLAVSSVIVAFPSDFGPVA